MSQKPLVIVPFVMVDEFRGMILSSRRWKPEPFWCEHGQRTWVLPLRDDPTLGRRLHGTVEDFGVMVDIRGCGSEARTRRRPS